MGQLVSVTRFFFDSIRCRRVKTVDVSSASDAEGVTSMGETGFCGILEKEGGGELTLEVYREQGDPEVDWESEAEPPRREHTIVMSDKSGQRWQYLNCVVAQANRKDDDQASHMMTVKVIWQRRKRLPQPI